MTRKRLLRPTELPWRLGCNARTIHAQLGSEPDDHDPLIGLMDTRALAEAAVRDHNAALDGVTGTPDRITGTPKRAWDRITRTPKPVVATPPNPPTPAAPEA